MIETTTIKLTYDGLPVWLVSAFAPTDHGTMMFLGIHVAASTEVDAKRIALEFWRADAEYDGDWSDDGIHNLNVMPGTDDIVHEVPS